MTNSLLTSDEILRSTREELGAIADMLEGMAEDLQIVLDREEQYPIPVKAILMKCAIAAASTCIRTYIKPHLHLEPQSDTQAEGE
jgi:hypothetical protein